MTTGEGLGVVEVVDATGVALVVVEACQTGCVVVVVIATGAAVVVVATTGSAVVVAAGLVASCSIVSTACVSTVASVATMMDSSGVHMPLSYVGASAMMADEVPSSVSWEERQDCFDW